jgi:Skp family chaperone for outer membrane proteins
MSIRISYAVLPCVVAALAFAASTLCAQEAAKPRKPIVVAIVDEGLVEQAHPLQKERAAADRKERAERAEAIKRFDDELAVLNKKWKTLEPASDEAKKVKEASQKLSAERNELMNKGPSRSSQQASWTEICNAIKVVCDREGIDLALPRYGRQGDGVLYLNESVDITTLVIAEVKAAAEKIAK